MDSTSQELSQDNLIAVQQRQQQELIKLLTQHFHNQFYQLACNTNNSSNNQQTPSRNAASNGPSTADRFSCPSSTAPQTNSAQNTMNAALSSLNNNNHLDLYPLESHRCEPAGPNPTVVSPTKPGIGPISNDVLTASTGTSNHHDHHEIPSAQQALARSMQSNPIFAPQAANQLSPLVDFANPSGFDSYQLYQFNIMNALGLNSGTNDESRLALSLRQQSIIQAIKQQQNQQSGCTREFVEDYPQPQSLPHPHPHPHQQHRHRGRINSFKNDGFVRDELDNEQVINGKSLLKFGINTILGRNSPKPNTQTNCETTTTGQTSARPRLSHYNTRADAGLARCIEDDDEDVDPSKRKRLITSESDALDSGSDTSSLQATSPVPQIEHHPSIFMKQQMTNLQSRDSNSFSATSGGDNLELMNRNHQQSLRHVAQPSMGGAQSLAPFLSNSASFPWTVSSRGKPRRGMMRRAVFSDGQRVGLEKRFQMQKYISKPDRKKLAEKLGLRDSQVKIWFQNRRMKWRNSKERELLSAGGSREQTLPTRNNPNPDLSDVGETIRRLTSSTNGSGTTASLISPSNLTNK